MRRQEITNAWNAASLDLKPYNIVAQYARVAVGSVAVEANRNIAALRVTTRSGVLQVINGPLVIA